LEEKHEIQRAGVFAYLGPIFSYLIGCLWDEEVKDFKYQNFFNIVKKNLNNLSNLILFIGIC